MVSVCLLKSCALGFTSTSGVSPMPLSNDVTLFFCKKNGIRVVILEAGRLSVNISPALGPSALPPVFSPTNVVLPRPLITLNKLVLADELLRLVRAITLPVKLYLVGFTLSRSSVNQDLSENVPSSFLLKPIRHGSSARLSQVHR